MRPQPRRTAVMIIVLIVTCFFGSFNVAGPGKLNAKHHRLRSYLPQTTVSRCYIGCDGLKSCHWKFFATFSRAAPLTC